MSRAPGISVRTLDALLDRLAADHAARTAFIISTGVTEQRLTFTQLRNSARSLAAGLQSLGFRRGDALISWLPNCVEWMVLQCAAAQLGVLVIALNTRFRLGELTHVLRTSQAKGIVLAPGFLDIDFTEIVRTAIRLEPTLHDHVEHVITLDHWAPNFPVAEIGADIALSSYGDLHEHGALQEVPGQSSDLTSAFTTSGTTAAPKLAAHDQEGIVLHSLNAGAALDIGPGDVMHCPLPLCGVFGFNAIFAALARGATCVTQAVFNGDEYARLIERHGITHFVGSEPMVTSILSTPGIDFRGPGTWRRGIVSIFAGTGAQFIAEADRRTGATWSDVYGSSECFALVAFWPVGTPVDDRGYKGGEVVSPDIQIRIIDPESGEELPPGERGELQIRGYNVLPGYYRNEMATAAAMAPGGWYRTGDLAYVPRDGWLVFLTRLGDSLRIHGFLVDPLEIEDYLGLHDAVDVVQVVGISGRDGDIPVAFVRLRNGIACSVEELQRFCKERLASYKVPVHIFFVDEFPTTMGTNGAKIQKGRLRELALETLARRPT